MQSHEAINQVLTSIVNNKDIFARIAEDMQERSNTTINTRHLYDFLNVTQFKEASDNVKT